MFCICPTTNQLENVAFAMEGKFVDVECIEIMFRRMEARVGKTRPSTRMIGHTCYLASGRKVNSLLKMLNQQLKESQICPMSSKDFGEDAAFLLYLVPIVVSIIYGAIDWAETAKTSTMPPAAYLDVSKSPYLFLVSLVAICLAVILEVRAANSPERNGIVQANITRMQILAVVVLIISFLASVSAGGYDLPTAFSLFVGGRYALIYAFFLIGLSLLLAPKQVLGNFKAASLPDIVGMLLVAGAPVLFYLAINIHLRISISAIGRLDRGCSGHNLAFTDSLFGKKSSQPQTQKQPVET